MVTKTNCIYDLYIYNSFLKLKHFSQYQNFKNIWKSYFTYDSYYSLQQFLSPLRSNVNVNYNSITHNYRASLNHKLHECTILQHHFGKHFIPIGKVSLSTDSTSFFTDPDNKVGRSWSARNIRASSSSLPIVKSEMSSWPRDAPCPAR